MSAPKRSVIIKRFVPIVFFTAYFLYFFIVNPYLMSYQEQVQLFRFDWNYVMDYLSSPGGFMEYLGAFIIQFYYYPIIGAFIITLSGIASYALSAYILKKYRFYGILWPYIPPLLFFILFNDYLFNPGYILGFLLILIFFAVYISFHKDFFRYSFGLIGWIFLYLTLGQFSFLELLLCILHELLFLRGRFRIYVVLAFLLLAALVPYFSWRFLYYIPFREAWSDPDILKYRSFTKFVLILIISFVPLLLILIRILPGIRLKNLIQSDWNLKSILFSVIIIIVFSIIVKRQIFEPGLRLFFKIDHDIQHSRWENVLKHSSGYSGTNHLILYYINLSLYKTGHLADNMFNYPQTGISGLYLDREGDELSLFLGGEIFYHLGDMNEAYRWAFDAMVAKGQFSPRLIKQLILTSMINGEYATAEKYLNIMDQSLFYRDWSKKYRNYLNNADILNHDPEITAKRKLLVHDDFLANYKYPDIGLKQLLKNHPSNRMAFEYYMSSLLLEKDLAEFSSGIDRLRDFGYKELPHHYEEALLLQMNYVKKNLLPRGYGIRKTTVEQFRHYSEAYSSYFGNPEIAAQSMYKSFGNTYWFYLHFVNNQLVSNESDHPFN